MKTMRTASSLAALVLVGLIASSPSTARIPEPDFTYYGSATSDGTPLFTGTIAVLPQSTCADASDLACGSDQDCLDLGRTGPCTAVSCTGPELAASSLASFTIPVNPPPDLRYILRVPVDSVDPRLPGKARPGDTVAFCLDQTDYNAVPVVMNIVPIGGDALASGANWDRIGLDPDSDGNFDARGLARYLDLDTTFQSGNAPRVYVRDAEPGFENPLGVAATADFILEVIPASTDDVVLQCGTQDVTTSGAGDYTFPIQCNDDVTIPAGGSVTISVPLIGDAVVETDEMFLLSILDAARVAGGNYLSIPIARPDAVGTILDDDHTPVVQIIDGEAVENAGNTGNCGSTPAPCLRFTATLSRPVMPGTADFTFGTALDGGGGNPAGAGNLSDPNNPDPAADYADTCAAGGCTVTVLDCASDPDCADGGQDGLRAEGFVQLQDDLLDEVSRETFLVEIFDASVALAASGRMSIIDDELFLRWAEREADEKDALGATCVPGVDPGCPYGLNAALDIVMDSQGKNLYVAGSTADAVAIFKRDRDTDPEPGKLAFTEAVQDETGQGFIQGIRGARALALSTNNRYLYVAGSLSHAIAVFNRSTFTGNLTFVESLAQGDLRAGAIPLTGLLGASDVVLSPEAGNPHVYLAATGSSAIVAFSRNASTGRLTPACDATGAPTTCTDIYRDGENGLNQLGGVSALAVSPDGEHVYAASAGDGAVTALAREATTGLLTLLQARVNGQDGTSTPCLAGTDPDCPGNLDGALSALVSPDGKHVYVAGQVANAIEVFSRNTLLADPDFGKLTHLQTLKQGDQGLNGLTGVAALAMDGAGKRLYGAGFLDDALVVLTRDDDSLSPTFGELTFLEDQQNGNLDALGAPDPVWTAPGIARSAAVIVSPVSGGNHVYVAGSEDNAVAVFRRVFAPPLNPTTTLNADWSSSHDPGVANPTTLLEFQWAGSLLDTPADPDQILAGYSLLIDEISDTEIDDTMEVAHVTGTAVACVDITPCGAGEVCEAGFCRAEHAYSQALTIGNKWYLHLRSCDNSGNCSATVHSGPYNVGASLDGDAVPDGTGIACVVNGDCSPGEQCVGSVCQYDNCPGLANPAQTDDDLDLIGDACDPCVDRDGDNFGSPGAPGCLSGAAVDCNDLVAGIFPGAPEGCNGIDNDCDGQLPAFELDADLDGFRVCQNDCNENPADTDLDGIPDGFQDNPDSPERCDGRDNNCDGSRLATEIDTDSDGFINCPNLPFSEDCQPTDALIYPGAPARCRNGQDNNCDSIVDATEARCITPTCLASTLPLTAGPDPTLEVAPSACGTGTTLLRSVDIIWGVLQECDQAGENCVVALRVEPNGGDPQVRLGSVNQVVCGGTAEFSFIDTLSPDAGDVDFYLMRESSAGPVNSYGLDTGVQPRFPDANDCPIVP